MFKTFSRKFQNVLESSQSSMNILESSETRYRMLQNVLQTVLECSRNISGPEIVDGMF